MNKFSPLEYWLNRRRQLPHFNFLREAKPDYSLGYYLALDYCIPLHNVTSTNQEVFVETWQKTFRYLEESYKIIEEFEDPYFTDKNIIDLDGEIASTIVEELGPPPVVAYPLYIVTVGQGEEERVVYIGKTSRTIRSRFNDGHSVALKLHNPIYQGLEKKVYFGCVTFLTEKEYLPLEWIYPLELGLSILDSIESGLIFHFTPELNTQKKLSNYAKIEILLNIENHSNESNYLHGFSINL